ncbi:MAG: tRNA (guanosine(46)-N7)-methyltransferase TrmB [Patescibacteria group bacterium]
MRVGKKPQYLEFNARANCFSEWQLHDWSLNDWLDGSYLMLEVGAGTAKVSLEFARCNPDRQVIALDKKSDRLGKAARVAESEGLSNIAFVQSDLRELQELVDLGGRADHIWVTFPDPYPRDRQEKHRLTYTSMLDIYYQLLKSDGTLEFKTDNSDLYLYSLDEFTRSSLFEVITSTNDLHNSGVDDTVALALTDYEKMFLLEGLTTKYIKASRVN